MKIIDCFTYNGEMDNMDIRISMLMDYVDEFWIIWGLETYKGAGKTEDIPDFKKYNSIRSKIKLIVVPVSKKLNNPWHREFYQKSYLGFHSSYWNKPKEESYIICSDVDEVWNPKKIEELVSLCRSRSGFFAFPIKNFYFRLNYQCLIGDESSIRGPYILRLGSIFSVFKRMELRIIAASYAARKNPLENDYGWHWSYLTVNQIDIKKKINSFSHDEPEVLRAIDTVIDQAINSNNGLFEGKKDREYWMAVEMDQLGPIDSVKFKTRYEKLILKPETMHPSLKVSCKLLHEQHNNHSLHEKVKIFYRTFRRVLSARVAYVRGK